MQNFAGSSADASDLPGVELLWGRIELERDECLKGCLSGIEQENKTRGNTLVYKAVAL